METETGTTLPEPTPPPTVADLGARYAGRITMTVPEWIAIVDNPIQRNTEMHAKRAKHLTQPSPLHAFVDMAVLPDGTRFKLDGHTRAWLWERHTIPRPEEVIVDCWEVPDVTTVELLYGHFDNPVAAESGTEQLTGALRHCGLDFETPWLRNGQFGSALRRAYSHVKGSLSGIRNWRELPLTFAAVEMFSDELLLLDSLAPPVKRFPGGIVTGFLVTMRRAGETRGLEFWRLYAEDKGHKAEGKMDAVQALSEDLLGLNPHRSRYKWVQETLYVRSVGAFIGFRDGQTYAKGLRTMSPETIKRFATGPRGQLYAKAK